MGDGSGEGPFLSHDLSKPNDVDDDAEGGVRESSESLLPSLRRVNEVLFEEAA